MVILTDENTATVIYPWLYVLCLFFEGNWWLVYITDSNWNSKFRSRWVLIVATMNLYELWGFSQRLAKNLIIDLCNILEFWHNGRYHEYLTVIKSGKISWGGMNVRISKKPKDECNPKLWSDLANCWCCPSHDFILASMVWCLHRY